MKNQLTDIPRRQFIQTSALATAGLFTSLFPRQANSMFFENGVQVSAHLWVYASKYPPTWDCSADLPEVFTDIKSAGYSGIELMDVLLKADDSVERIEGLIKKHNLPVTGCSFGADMWNKAKHDEILSYATTVIDRLHQLGGETFGVSVGNVKRIKTDEELDAQSNLLKKLIPICKSKGITLNLHNHTYEVENNFHDLKGTIARIPDIKLGPDLNWLIRGGVDPVWFIETYQKQIVYLHIRDQKENGKWTEAVGEGATDFKAIAKALKRIGYKGRVAVELAFDEPPKRKVSESWKISRTYVRDVFGW